MRPLRCGQALVVVAALAATGTPATAQERPTCHGLPVTVAQDRGVIYGTPGPDVVRLARPGTVYGGRGNDVICGSTGRDRIFAGGGQDVVLAGAGADLVRGGDGRDSIFGEHGADRISGGPHADTIVSGSGNDRVTRGAGGRAPRGPASAHTSDDVVAFNTYAASVLIPQDGIETLMESGSSLSFSRSLLTSGSTARRTVWASTPSPLPANTVTWNDERLSVYASTSEPITNAVIDAQASTPAAAGSSWTIEADGAFAQGGRSGSPATRVTNNSPRPMTTGLSQVSILNGANASAPLGAMLLPPRSTAALLPVPTISVFAMPAGAPGQVIGPPPPNQATSKLSPGKPTATFLYSATTGRFQTEQASGE